MTYRHKRLTRKRRKMESKILNFPDAMKLVEILSKYDLFKDADQQNMREFVAEFFDSVDKKDLIEIFKLIFRGDLGELSGEMLIKMSIVAFKNNKIISLMDFYATQHN